MRRNEAQQQRQNPVKASNGSYLRSPFDISQRFAQLAARQVEQGGTRRHLLASASRGTEDRDGLDKASSVMRPWSRAGVGASQLSVKDKNMQRTQAEKIYGDDEQLYSKSGDAHVVDEATAGAEKAKAKKKKGDKGKHSTTAIPEDEAFGHVEEAEHGPTSSSASATTSSGLKRQFAVDMRDSEAMQKMVPSHVRKQRRRQQEHREYPNGDVSDTRHSLPDDEDDESFLRPQAHPKGPSTKAQPTKRAAVVERVENDADEDGDGGALEVPVRPGHKRAREEPHHDGTSRTGSMAARMLPAAPRNRLQQLQAMRDSALMGGRKRR